MDVTPQLIEQIDFSEKFRGYDPDQVDDFLERVGATIAELNNAVREANLRAERAEQAAREAEHAAREAAAAPPAPAVMSEAEAATTAARTLMLAQRTADEVTATAQAEADQLRVQAQRALDEASANARVEGDRLIADARATADGLVAQARQDAERELVERRAAVAEEVGALEARRGDLLSDVEAIEQRIDQYRDSLDRVHGAIRTVLDDPDGLRAQPPLDLAAGDSAISDPIVEATASDAAIAMTSPSPNPTTVEPDVFAGGGAGQPETASWALGPPAAPADVPDEPLWASPAADQSLASASQADPAFSGSGSEFLAAPPAEEPTPVVDWTDTGDAWRPEATSTHQAFTAEPTGSTPTADPWGPGSWSEVVGDTPTPTTTLWEDPARTGATASVPATEFVPMTGSTPVADAFSTGSQDRFLRDLDEAVNQSDPADADDAMTAFFEGDDVPASRRFRRR